MKRFVTRIAIGIIVILVNGYIFFRIPPGQKLLRQTLESELSAYFGQQVTVGDLRTDLFSHVRIQNFSQADSSHRFVSCDRILVKYSLWGFVAGKIAISSIELTSPRIHIYQDSQGDYNLPQPLRRGKSDHAPAEASGKTGMSVHIDHLHISNLSVHYHDIVDSLQITLPQINATLNSITVSNRYVGELKIDRGSLGWRGFNEPIDALELHFALVSDTLNLSSLRLRTANISLISSGKYDLKSASLSHGNLDAVVNLALLNPLLALQSNDSLRSFSGELKAHAHLEGPLRQLDADVRMIIPSGTLYGIPIRELSADGRAAHGAYTLSRFSVNAFNGHMACSGSLSVENATPQFSFRTAFSNFHLSEMLPILYHENTQTPRGVVSGELQFSGAADAWTSAMGQGRLTISNIVNQTQRYGDVNAGFTIDRGDISCELRQGNSQFALRGQVRPNSTIQAKFRGAFSSIESIAGLFNVQHVNGQFDFEGQVSGTVQHPAAALDFTFQDGHFSQFPIGYARGSIAYLDSGLIVNNFQAAGRTENLSALNSDSPIDSMSGRLQYEVAANGSLEQLQASGNLRWENCRLNAFTLDSLSLHASYADQKIIIHRILASKAANQVVICGEIDAPQPLFADVTVQLFEGDSAASPRPAGELTIAGAFNRGAVNGVISGEAIRIAPLLELASFPTELDGALTFACAVTGPLRAPHIALEWTTSHLGSPTTRLDSLAGHIEFADEMLTLHRVRASHAGGMIEINGRLPFDGRLADLPASPDSRLTLVADHFDLTRLNPFLPDSFSIAGELTAALTAAGPALQGEIDGFLDIRNGKFLSAALAAIDTATVHAQCHDRRIQLQQFTGRLKNAPFSFQGVMELLETKGYAGSLHGSISDVADIALDARYISDEKKHAVLRINRLNLGSLAELFSMDVTLAGEAELSFSYSDSADTPVIYASAKSNQIGLAEALLDSLQISARWTGGLLKFSESGFKINDGWVKFGGSLPVDFPQEASAGQTQEMNFFAAAGNLNLDWLAPFAPSLETIEGSANCKIFVAGPVAAPRINGYFFVQHGLVKFRNVETPIQAINLAMQAQDNELVLDDFSGALGDGTFALFGRTHLADNKLTHSSFTLKLNKATVTHSDLFKLSILDGNLTLTQDEENLKLKGAIHLSEAKYTMDFKPKLEELLNRWPKRPSQQVAGILDNMLLDVNVQGQENVWIDNNIAKIKMSSNLNIFGTAARPNVSGRLEVKKGYVLYLDRKFKITEGLIDFTDPQRINPHINLTATCTVTDYQAIKETSYEITLKISGQMEKPDLVLTSNPSLDKADIVAMLTVGRTRGTLFTGLEAGKTSTFQDLLVDRFKEFTSQRIAGMTEQQIGRTLSLESISIEGNLFQVDKNWGPRLTATKQLSDRINLTYSTVVGHANEQQIKLGYQLYKHLSVIGNTGQTGKSGLDLKFNFKFH
ncbi:MAG: translocation/assembly module TamB domain-containing protein [Candidatus Zhuqueibacterota bacterium]